MNQQQKLAKIRLQAITHSFFTEDCIPEIKRLIQKAINSPAIDLEEYADTSAPAILPKSVLIAVFQSMADQYSPKGTSYEKEVKKNVQNLKPYV